MRDEEIVKRGKRHGPTVKQEEYYKAWSPYKKAKKKGYKSIHDRFMTDEQSRMSQLDSQRTESACSPMDALEQEDHTYKAAREDKPATRWREEHKEAVSKISSCEKCSRCQR